MEERLQKILAQAGYGSRRKCEELIIAGRVRVNGQRVEIGAKADPEKDEIMVDKRPIDPIEQKVYIALYKPRNVLSDREPMGDDRRTIHDLVPDSKHLFAVGRLDFESEGLILLTNDGALKNKLSHPRFEHEKEYRVLVADRPDDEQMATMRRGIVLEDGYRTRPAKVYVESLHGKGTWLRVILKEGRKRQIRETCRAVGLPIVRIVRVRIATLELGRMRPKEWRYLTEAEVSKLRSSSSAPEKKQGGSPKKSAYRKPDSRSSGERPEREDAQKRPSRKSDRGGSSRSSYRKPGAEQPRSDRRDWNDVPEWEQPDRSTDRRSHGGSNRRPSGPRKSGTRPGRSGKSSSSKSK